MAGSLSESPPFLYVSAQARGPEVFATLRGELDIAGAPAVAEMLAEAVPAECRRVVVDVSGLTFMDVAGLRALLGGAGERSADLEIVLRAPTRPVRRLLELTGNSGLVEFPRDSRGTNVALTKHDAKTSTRSRFTLVEGG